MRSVKRTRMSPAAPGKRALMFNTLVPGPVSLAIAFPSAWSLPLALANGLKMRAM